MPELCSIEPRLPGQWRINIRIERSVWHSPYEKYYIENLKRTKKTKTTRRLDAEQKSPKLVSELKKLGGKERLRTKMIELLRNYDFPFSKNGLIDYNCPAASYLL